MPLMQLLLLAVLSVLRPSLRPFSTVWQPGPSLLLLLLLAVLTALWPSPRPVSATRLAGPGYLPPLLLLLADDSKGMPPLMNICHPSAETNSSRLLHIILQPSLLLLLPLPSAKPLDLPAIIICLPPEKSPAGLSPP